MKNTTQLIFICLLYLFLNSQVKAETFEIALTVPNIKTDPYHKPYIAVWLETKERKGLHTFAFWHEQEDWFKDLRQWWRKIGRKSEGDMDGFAGATKKPGVYKLSWDGTLASGKKLPAGEYVLHFESVREQGSREYLRQKIQIGNKQKQSYQLFGKHELGEIKISIL